MSRRRCCICFGLERDDSRKRGQIAHLDEDPANNDFDNLAYLCLDHHDEYDGSTSQSKSLSLQEVKVYLKELYRHYSEWSSQVSRSHLLNYLAYQVSNEDIARSVVEIASQCYFYGPDHAVDVLTMPELKLSDMETIGKHLVVLDRCASWGLLTYEEEVLKDDEYDYEYTLITVTHFPICEELVRIIQGWITEKGNLNWN